MWTLARFIWSLLSRRSALLPPPLLGTVLAVFPHTALQTVFGISRDSGNRADCRRRNCAVLPLYEYIMCQHNTQSANTFPAEYYQIFAWCCRSNAPCRERNANCSSHTKRHVLPLPARTKDRAALCSCTNFNMLNCDLQH